MILKNSPKGIENIDRIPNIEEQFALAQQKNEIAEVLKELFDQNKIYMISDLSIDEIKLSTRIHMLAEMKNINVWKSGLVFFFQLLLCKNRKSRKEIIEAIKGYQHQTLFQKMNPFNRGGLR